MINEPLSVGWIKYDRPTRRASPAYVAGAEDYTATCHRLGEIRTIIISLAEIAGVLPPVTREDLRTGMRNRELARIGLTTEVLLEKHAEYCADNREAMAKLREVNNSITTENGD